MRSSFLRFLLLLFRFHSFTDVLATIFNIVIVFQSDGSKANRERKKTQNKKLSNGSKNIFTHIRNKLMVENFFTSRMMNLISFGCMFAVSLFFLSLSFLVCFHGLVVMFMLRVMFSVSVFVVAFSLLLTVVIVLLVLYIFSFYYYFTHVSCTLSMLLLLYLHEFVLFSHSLP